MTRITSFRFPVWMLLLLVAAPMLGWYQSASAADPKFVGVLALAVEEEGAKRLNLSEETLQKLLAFIDEREEKAVNLVQQIRTLPEAEQELVAGFHTEYTGMKFAMFFMGEYINMVTMSSLVTLLFLGGWNAYGLPVWPIVAFALKVGFLLCVFIWLRSTFPRIRYDRLMTFGWKVLLPLCFLNLLITSTLKVI